MPHGICYQGRSRREATMGKVSSGVRRELVGAIAERYRGCGREDKRRILDEFVALTGYHRKHAIRVLSRGIRPGAAQPRVGTRARVYDEALRKALVVLWEASDRICGKRLRPLLPVLVAALERHGHLDLAETVRAKLLAVSASTIDRLLAPTREAVRGKRRRGRQASAARASVPVRTAGDWKEPPPGYMEADLVAHCGGRMAGSFAHTLVLTDIASGWTECIALAVREGTLIVAAVEPLLEAMPFPLLGIDTDNGSEFVNEAMVAFCAERGIEFTRSRPYRKNDQAWVEQKNSSVVRRLVGHGRLEGIVGAEALGRLYSASRLFVNFFQPSFKLLDKRRVGSRTSKRYRTPETPCSRLVASDAIEEAMKQRLRAVLVTLDPLRLLAEIRTVQQHLAGLSDGQRPHLPPYRDSSLERFLGSLSTAWKEGEVRPTHRAKAKPERYWRTRKDPFEGVWAEVLLWLECEPNRTAKELFARLQDEHTGTFPDGQLRTLQRRVKEWRRAAAQRLVFSGSRAADPPREMPSAEDFHRKTPLPLTPSPG